MGGEWMIKCLAQMEGLVAYLVWEIPHKEKNMKKGTAIALLLVAAVLFISGCTSFKEWTGKTAPDFTATDIDGKTFILSQQKGKDVIVVFWATSCPYCKKEIPNLISLRNSYEADSVVIIAISNEDNAVLRTFRQANSFNCVIASMENLPPPYGEVTGIPTIFFIDKNGTIRYATHGYRSFKELTSLVSALDVTTVPAK
jgi:peroxiredoxin